jgi:hypothetical protein
VACFLKYRLEDRELPYMAGGGGGGVSTKVMKKKGEWQLFPFCHNRCNIVI